MNFNHFYYALYFVYWKFAITLHSMYVGCECIRVCVCVACVCVMCVCFATFRMHGMRSAWKVTMCVCFLWQWKWNNVFEFSPHINFISTKGQVIQYSSQRCSSIYLHGFALLCFALLDSFISGSNRGLIRCVGLSFASICLFVCVYLLFAFLSIFGCLFVWNVHFTQVFFFSFFLSFVFKIIWSVVFFISFINAVPQLISFKSLDCMIDERFCSVFHLQ